MPSTYKREKPWDTDDIDKWAVCILMNRIENILVTKSFLDRAVQAR